MCRWRILDMGSPGPTVAKCFINLIINHVSRYVVEMISLGCPDKIAMDEEKNVYLICSWLGI
jgi:hypothetical protein